MQPEQATFLLNTIMPALKSESRTTKSVIEAVPVDKGDYRPEPIAKSANELAWHIASAENMFYSAVINGEFNFSNTGQPDNIKNSADIGKWYAAQSEANFDRLTKLSGEQLTRIVDFRGMFQLPAVMYLNFALSHSVHHRGQLSVYLRPMGSKVPAIYGESYDSREARLAAQAGKP